MERKSFPLPFCFAYKRAMRNIFEAATVFTESPPTLSPVFYLFLSHSSLTFSGMF